jgi:hypothetical protein
VPEDDGIHAEPHPECPFPEAHHAFSDDAKHPHLLDAGRLAVPPRRRHPRKGVGTAEGLSCFLTHQTERNAMEALQWASILQSIYDSPLFCDRKEWDRITRHCSLLYQSRRFRLFAKRFFGACDWHPGPDMLEERARVALESAHSPDNPFGDPEFIQRVILDGKAPVRHAEHRSTKPLLIPAP